MKKIFAVLLLSLFNLLFSACASNQPDNKEEIPQIIDVKIHTEPETGIEPGKPVTIEAWVTQGSEYVDDADEVEFEIWNKTRPDDKHELIKGKLQGKGVYSIQKTFDAPGSYYVVSHVTARGMHNMPRKELTVTQK
ncbi:FixH family protein [Ferviditalea candida]|uniref:FixH family protein n=1 Tax=Ferviditalea candida TaxID=3108399 RepID=A0ABU5ZL74_9BACL|nr:FixH family protein [Paenibacillaceae bacterium T2]